MSDGNPSTTIYDPPPCTRHCTERHEAVHRRDLAPCCKRAKKAYDKAKTEEAKTAVQDKFNEWGKANEDFLECRAYAESAKCGQEFLKANCDKASAEISDVEITPEDDEAFGDWTSLRLASSRAVSPDESESMAEEAAEDGGTEQPAPEACCGPMRRYARVSAARRDTVCARAGKALTPCPF